MVMMMDDTWLWLLNATWLNFRKGRGGSWNLKNQIINIIMIFLMQHATIQTDQTWFY
jgi:hypothetical protein